MSSSSYFPSPAKGSRNIEGERKQEVERGGICAEWMGKLVHGWTVTAQLLVCALLWAQPCFCNSITLGTLKPVGVRRAHGVGFDIRNELMSFYESLIAVSIHIMILWIRLQKGFISLPVFMIQLFRLVMKRTASLNSWKSCLAGFHGQNPS